MLYTELKDIYSQQSYLENEFPFDQYYPLIQSFLVKELKYNASYFSPYRFAYDYGIDPKKAITFFLALANKNGIFAMVYKYECENCGSLNLILSEDHLFNFECDECKEPEHLKDSNFLDEVKVIFEFKENISEGLKQSLIALPSFEEILVSKEGNNGSYEATLREGLKSNTIQTEHKSIVVNDELSSLDEKLSEKLGYGLSRYE